MSAQPDLFGPGAGFSSAVIARRRDFEALFDGYKRLLAVSYVVSPSLVAEFLDARGFESAEVVVGENLADAYKGELSEAGAPAAEALLARAAEGRLRLFVPERTLHTKLYILERPGEARVIVTSANLTETARRAGRQVNYAWLADLPEGHPVLARARRDYEAHKAMARPFLGDLEELLRGAEPAARAERIEAWLRGGAAEDLGLEARKALRELAAAALEPAESPRESVLTLRLPEAPAARREVERALAPLSPALSGGSARVAPAAFARFVAEAHGLPLLRVDPGRGEVRASFDGSPLRLDKEPAQGAPADAALADLEGYLDSVGLGHSPEPALAKAAMFEALMGVFAAPFAHQEMRGRRARFGSVDPRGPRVLFIHGPSQNGKSTFLRLALSWLAGRPVEPLPGSDFAKRRILGAVATGTEFPLVFDDLVLATRQGLFEEVLKSHWESWWREDCPGPQLVMSSNAAPLKAWAKSRLRRLDFDVHFAGDARGKERLASLLRAPSPLFGGFARLMLARLRAGAAPEDDDLAGARAAFAELYRLARRTPPPYFPAEPVERSVDPGRRAWRDLLDRLGKAKVRWEDDRALVEFAEDIQHHELREFEAHLPQAVKFRRRGKTLVIETPQAFAAWLGRAPRPWWRRLLGR